MKPQQRVEHTEAVSSRRRALFPCDDDGDSDLGCISPLNFDDEGLGNVKAALLDEDYDIIGVVVKGDALQTPVSAAAVTKVFTPSASDESPTQRLKTPHDISDNTKFPKLVRTKQVDTALTLDCKNPKVRTALFPEIDMSVPSRTFYPKGDSDAAPRGFVAGSRASPRKAKKKQGLYLCSRKSRYRSGQINAGVRHKIKKRKVKKISRIAALQAAINIIQNSPLNTILPEPSPSQSPPSPTPSPSPPPRDPTPSPEPDPSKKFFKSSRHKGVVTVNANIKLEMNNGRLTLLSGKQPVKRARPRDDTNPSKRAKLDFDTQQPLIPEKDISSIIQTLEDNKENEKNDVLMSPTSQMCNMTSGLALNSPKKARDLSAVLESMPGNNEGQTKLFPVFYPGRTALPAKSEGKVAAVRKFRGLGKDQMLLDAGQKRWGVTQCSECKIVYHMGDPGDEIMHLNYHNASHFFRFNGWKNERVVTSGFLDGRIVQIVPGDPKIWWKKVKEVMEVINRDLGYYDIEFNTANSQIFFYIKNKTIIGALVAEAKTSAHKLLTTHQDQVDLCSEESYPIKCGVSRIWVAQNQRKKGVASTLMDSLKRNFIFGYILKNEDVAFSSPTEMGKLFGQSYFKTPNFFIYFV
ncbi:N-acetyltransferase eco isoform X1 [Zophobas morio]|uniref:N-acetyltransferase eco isoform X1 n=1 Tax=Zophobas morio TaxID=2755281 RepID=UPI003082B926